MLPSATGTTEGLSIRRRYPVHKMDAVRRRNSTALRQVDSEMGTAPSPSQSASRFNIAREDSIHSSISIRGGDETGPYSQPTSQLKSTALGLPCVRPVMITDSSRAALSSP